MIHNNSLYMAGHFEILKMKMPMNIYERIKVPNEVLSGISNAKNEMLYLSSNTKNRIIEYDWSKKRITKIVPLQIGSNIEGLAFSEMENLFYVISEKGNIFFN